MSPAGRSERHWVSTFESRRLRVNMRPAGPPHPEEAQMWRFSLGLFLMAHGFVHPWTWAFPGSG